LHSKKNSSVWQHPAPSAVWWHPPVCEHAVCILALLQFQKLYKLFLVLFACEAFVTTNTFSPLMQQLSLPIKKINV
jgi:hypothetical protein